MNPLVGTMCSLGKGLEAEQYRYLHGHAKLSVLNHHKSEPLIISQLAKWSLLSPT
jgi:hypothetical protein